MEHRPAPSTQTLRTHISLSAGDAETQTLDGELVYDPADPYAVQLHLQAPSGEPVVWTFARDLLADGLFDPTGDGDVLVWPCLGIQAEAIVIIELRSPSGMAMLQTASRPVHEFVEATFAAVPAGTESSQIDLDAMVAHLRD